MSFQAMTWAAGERCGGPSGKATLWAIANFANHDGVAWPSQQLLAEQSDQSVDSVQKRLADLHRMALLRRVPLKFGGRKTVDFIILAISPFFRATLAEIEPLLPRGCVVDPRVLDVTADCGSDEKATLAPGGAETLGESDAGASGDVTANCGSDKNAALPQTLPQPAENATALVRQQEPVTEPREPRIEREARAGETEKPSEPTATDRKRFEDAVKAHWPNLALDDSERGFTAWFALTVDQRTAALDRIPDFVALHRTKKRDHLPALSTYFRQLRFEALPPKPADGGSLSVALPARSEGWCAMFFRLAISGSTQSTFAARRMLADAEFDRPAWCRSDEMPSADDWPKIERGSEQFKAWRKHLGEQGIWLKPECFGVWLWVPSEWPQEDVKTARTG